MIGTKEAPQKNNLDIDIFFISILINYFLEELYL